MKNYLFASFWLLLIIFLVAVSSTFHNRSDAMVALVESGVTAISFQKAVIIEDIRVVPGQQVKKGDTILKVSHPDFILDIEKVENRLEKVRSQMAQAKQDFASKRSLVEIDAQGKINRLEMELSELSTKHSWQRAVDQRLGSSREGSTYYDTLNQLKIQAIRNGIVATKKYAEKEVARQQQRMRDALRLFESEEILVQKELLALREKVNQLSKVAVKDGIVGTVSVQLHELVPPYKKALTILERSPTMIKAFMDERISYPIHPGDSVEVVSENRRYKIAGAVTELGARVTGYPSKIQPNDKFQRYGQEVFVEIPDQNNFRNGEKVFVYPIEK